jgi:catechol 2,3-dioxygenase-like lactoylglutathione lyase family enzyme
MFDHVTLRASDLDASRRLYATLLDAVGFPPPETSEGFAEWQDFGLAQATDERPATRELHVAFAAPSRAAVDAFWRAGTAAGFPDDGAPGDRPEYSPSYYGAFLRDPDGNSVEAVHRQGMRTDGHVDHVWLRVSDLSEARRFYTTVAPHAGFRVDEDTPELVSFVPLGDGGGDLGIVPGDAPTTGAHLAFATTDDEDVRAFHAAAVGAGFRDEGGPGERRVYHPGYYAAFVLDPDGTNVEVVNHHRQA